MSEHSGRWWIPGDSGDPIAGRLSLADDSHPFLELDGYLNARGRSADLQARIPLVHGITPFGEPFTVLDLAETSRQVPPVGAPQATGRQGFHARYALQGEHAPSPEVRVAVATMRFAHLEDWADLGPFHRFIGGREESDGTLVQTIEYWTPPARHAELDGFTVTLHFSPEQQVRAHQHEARLVPVVDLHLDSAVPLEEFRQEYLRPLSFLFSFGLDNECYVTSLSIKPERLSGEFPRLVAVHFAMPRPRNDVHRVIAWEMVLSLSDCRERFSDVVAWG